MNTVASAGETCSGCLLDPGQIKVDGRDNRDRLAFAAQYASLILYYNQADQASGDWRPFLLKDPVILLAAISKTDYADWYRRFVEIETRWLASMPAADQHDADALFVNAVCAMAGEMFAAIDTWFHIMEHHDLALTLRAFLKHHISANLAPRLADMTMLQRRLGAATGGRVAVPAQSVYRSFRPEWQQRAGAGTAMPDLDGTNSSVRQMAEAVAEVFHALFDVVMQVVDYAKQAFYALVPDGDAAPDTALLIAFSELIALQQQEINRYSQQHLDFYYERVLRQELLPAQADSVVVCLTLTDRTAALTVPAGTEFLAGRYPDNTPIVFCNASAVVLSQAALGLVETLYYDQALFRTTIEQPDQVVRNQLQEITSWSAFGSRQGTAVTQGFAIESPMLFLQGGQRTITLTLAMAYAAGGPPLLNQVFADSRFFLSTASDWLEVTSWCVLGAADITVALPVSAPPIAGLTVNPDGYSSTWPLFKTLLGPSAPLDAPLLLQAATIAVEVDGLTQFSLANNASALPAVGPAQILGPVPALGAGLYVGSAECFGKPLSALVLSMNWDNVPASLRDYYAEYNWYLDRQAPPTTAPAAPQPMFCNTAFGGQWRNLCGQTWTAVATVAGAPGAPALASADMLPDGGVTLFQQLPVTASSSGADAAAAGAAASKPAVSKPEASDAEAPNLTSSVFSFAFDGAYVPAPALMLAPLPAIASATDGYLGFTLDQPAPGFGNSLYAQVVSAISLYNAQILIGEAGKPKKRGRTGALSCLLARAKRAWSKLKGLGKGGQRSASDAAPGADATPQQAARSRAAAARAADGAPALQPLPNLPYCPKTSAVMARYQARSTCVIGAAATPAAADGGPYPLKLYHYGSFTTYLAYDAQAGAASNTGFANLVPKVRTAAPALALFPGVSGQGCLYLALDAVLAPATVTLFAQVVSDGATPAPGTQNVGYFYWSPSGWQTLPCLRDETAQLTRSGIITFDLPGLPAKAQGAGGTGYATSPVMPGAGFWIAIASVAPGLVVELSYLNTQALTLTRANLLPLPAGQVPQIAAGTISAAPASLPAIATVAQPSPSFGGWPAEDRSVYSGFNSFYRRVSERINNKDRAASAADYVALAHEACIDVFYARVISPPTTTPASAPAPAGAVRVGLVRRYASAADPNAFRPVLSGDDQAAILDYLVRRASAMAAISVINLKQQVVTIHATVVLSADADATQAVMALNRRVKLYLSPWIDSNAPQMDIARGLQRAGLLDVMTRWPEVAAVSALSIWLQAPAGGPAHETTEDPVVAGAADAILVPALDHVWTTQAAAAPARTAGAPARGRHG